jgi:hypothetical protein
VTSPTPEPGAVASPARDGRDGANGRSGPQDIGRDPAHGGPLPQATLPELIGRLINDLSDLADRQIELAKQEIGEAKDEAIAAIKRIAIGAGVAVAAALLLVIWAWTAFIWFFNWLFGHIRFGTPFGEQSLAWVGWLLGVLVPGLAAWFAWSRFIRPGISQAKSIFPPLPRTRETLKEDLEWVKHLRTRSGR